MFRISLLNVELFLLFVANVGNWVHFSVSFGTLEVQHVTNKSQRLKVGWVSQKDISVKINVRRR